MEDAIHIPSLLDRLEARPDLIKYLCSVLAGRPKFSKSINRNHFPLADVIGILRSDQSICEVRNPIYQRALDEAGLCSKSEKELRNS